jgi:hypothetical protein
MGDLGERGETFDEDRPLVLMRVEGAEGGSIPRLEGWIYLLAFDTNSR